MKTRTEATSREVQDVEGEGGGEGIVLPLQVITKNVYDILDMQWIASKACSSSVCDQTKGKLYNPSESTSTGKDFHINYLQGNVSGPIVWDEITVGEYAIGKQALGAVDSVTSQLLDPLFSGILGLALPLNSVIAGIIAPVTSNSPDGAAWASNLFSITPASSAPSSRFLSLLLSRPGSSAVPAQLGIGRHPAYVRDPARVEYSPLQSQREGTLYWKVVVRAVTVWAAGVDLPVQLGRGSAGAVYPSAVLDSGVPLILTTRAVANGIYGAIGVSPSDNGQYWVPCTTPLNLTVTVAGLAPISVHPLDLTAEPTKDNKGFCTGLIQVADALELPTAAGDIILGVPFLRNTYTVMAYEPPDAAGSFNASAASSGSVVPRLGLLGITDPSMALGEFNTVRVLKKPISPDTGSGSGNPGSGSGSSGVKGGTHLAVWTIVLISVLGVLVLCAGAFGLRWWLARRKRIQNFSAGGDGGGGVLASLGRATAYDGGYAYALTSMDDGTRGRGWEGGRSARKGVYVEDETLAVGGSYGAYRSAKVRYEEEEDRQAGEMGYRIRGTHKSSTSDGAPLLPQIELEPVWPAVVPGTRDSSRRRVVDEFGATQVERWGEEDHTLLPRGNDFGVSRTSRR
ncbi:hypothetical protein DXG01_000699 [Tephrocybe rancida]|nr:hypothetical protein DXG01_000699 [Tephrocybe rancida]